MRFLFNGLSYFGKRLVQDLADFDSRHTFQFFDTYTSRLEQLKFIGALPFADAVVSMNGVSDASGSMNAVLAMKKKLIMLWQGTDVLIATNRAGSRTLNRKYIDRASHFAVAPWLQEELRAIGISGEILSFSWFDDVALNPAFPEMSAYTYIPTGKEAFYGWPLIGHLARENPSVPFYVAGTRGDNLERLPNISYLGWLPAAEMLELSKKSPVYLRFTVHDGFPHSLTQALACGNEILWSMPYSYSHLAVDEDSATQVFRHVKEQLMIRGLVRNENNIRFAKENFSREKVLSHFLHTITNVAAG